MHRIVKSMLVALFAVMCMGALAATSASAVEPLFLTESKKALLFTADNIGTPTLRGKRAGVEGTITCEKSAGHGFALDKSPLSREVEIEFSGKCEQTLNGTKETCGEPIKPKKSYGELGLLNGHVLLLVAPETGTEFVEVKCGNNNNTKVLGAVIGEFPLNGRGGSKQYSTSLKEFLLEFTATGVKQNIETINLLGVEMKGVSLKVEGFLGEGASEEATALLLLNGGGTIDP
jgi:hypothetical protein